MDACFGRYGLKMHEVEEDAVVAVNGIQKGPWTDEEDALLFNYVSLHGEGRWNSVAVNTGLKRTGKSCRLRWLNYLRPDVLRGNITLEEQLLILELHSRWGNRWSKIAKHIPGRTDNEIKNYWRTRVQKQAKNLKCDVDSQQFRDMTRDVFIPRLMEKIRASKADTADFSESYDQTKDQITGDMLAREPSVGGMSSVSWDSQVSPTSGLTESAYSSSGYENNEDNHNILVESDTWTDIDAHQASEAHYIDQSGNNFWLDGGHGRFLDIQAWNEESLRLLRQHLLEEDC